MTSTGPTPPELNEMQRQEMARQIAQIGARLRDTADRIDHHAGVLSTSDHPAASIAADVLSDYTALGTNIAPVVWGIVRELGRTT